MQVTLVRRGAPTHPYHCRRNFQMRKALVFRDSMAGWAAAMWYQPLFSYSTGSQCLYKLERAHSPPAAPIVSLGTKWCGAGVAACWRG